MKKIFWLLLILATVGFVLPLTALDGQTAATTTVKKKPKAKVTRPKSEPEPPIEIVADRLDAYNDKKLVVFSGNAVATQGKRVMKSDKILLFYRQDADGKTKPPPGPGSIASGGDLERIEAEGNVMITEEDRTVTGEKAVFEQEKQQIVITGNTVLKEGKNVIQGQKITVYLAENRAVVDGEEKKRVTATIYPQEGQTDKKEKR